MGLQRGVGPNNGESYGKENGNWVLWRFIGIRGFPKLGVPFLGVPIMRTIVYWGLFWDFGKLPYYEL